MAIAGYGSRAMVSGASPSSLIFGRYAVLRRVAVGGMGEIFLARQVGVSGFERPVILKSLLPDLLEHDGSVEMFLDEARVAAHLNHPNVVSLYEVGAWQGTFYIAMEYIEGENLGRLAKAAARASTPLPHRVCAQMIRDAALGLDHAHHARDSQGQSLELVHRDISPQNIMVRLDGLTKVVDFGVAKATIRASRTRTGVLKGKLRYMSPEQVRNEPVSGTSDQFALGVVLWELCTRRPFIDTDNPAEAMRRIALAAVPRPSQFVEGLSPLLEQIILRMLHRAPGQRFARCADVARALQTYLDEAPEPPEESVPAVVTRLVGDVVLARLRDAGAGEPGLPQVREPSNVSCPRCGQSTPATSRFCPACGNSLTPPAGDAAPKLLTPVSGNDVPRLARTPASGAAAPDLAMMPALREPPVHLGDEDLPDAPTAKAPARRGDGAVHEPPTDPTMEVPAPLASALAGPPAAHEDDEGPPALGDEAPGPTVKIRAMDAQAQMRRLTLLVVAGEPAQAARLREAVAQFSTRHHVEAMALSDTHWCLPFGLPQAHAEDATRALQCAEDLGGAGLNLRRGLESGVVRVSAEAGASRLSGVGLERAQALADAAVSGELLVGASVKSLLVEAGGVRIGMARELPGGTAWRVESGAPATRVDALVGRDEALTQAALVVEAACRSEGGARLFVGPSGVGRSRFLEAVAELATGASPRVVYAWGGDPRSAGALGLWRTVFAALSRAATGGDASLPPLSGLGFSEPEAAALWRRLARGAPQGGGLLPAGDGAVVDAIQRVAKPSGLLLLVDDMHRVDGPSLEMLAGLLAAKEPGVSLVATGDVDAVPTALASLPVTVLEGLSPSELNALLTASLGMALSPSLERAVADRVRGNPAHALALVRLLVSVGVLQRTEGGFQSNGPLSPAALPQGLGQALGARLELLPAASLRFLQRAAVEGSLFCAELVRASLLASDGASVLEDAEWVVPVPGQPGIFRFRSEEARQVLRERLSPSQLRSAHQELAEALEMVAFAQEPAREVRVADHLLGADAAGAPAACERAGDWFAARGEWRSAVEFFRWALGRAPGATAAVVRWQLDVLARAAGCLTQADPAAVDGLVTPWLDRVPVMQTPSRWAEVARRLAVAELKLGRVDDAEVRLGMVQGPAGADPEVEALVLCELARVREAKGETTAAVELLARAFQRMGNRTPHTTDFFWEHYLLLGRLQQRLGQLDRARVAFTRAAEQARSVGSAAGQARALSQLAGLRVLAGEPAQALSDLERALALAEQGGDAQEVARIHYNAGRLLVAGGRAPEARERLEQARERARVAGWREGEALAAQVLGAMEARAPRRGSGQ
ncbi:MULTISPECIES: protein kinase domain-containing protein [unclassified Corallococcus]|uniref:protein kinase domain-containing protein n=1 Tax=unclassified Corallococcus TaxID=2685029 RepID=UPI001F5D96B9|nr:MULTISPECIES: protein kinase [unclassified Corallococcus]WAS86405.1 protein kinase [Corallococcus sp. NCRR]